MGAGVSLKGQKMNLQLTDPDAEKMVLGAILLNPAAINDVARDLSPVHFSGEQSALIYGAMLDLSRNGNPIDLVTVKNTIGEKIQGNFLVSLVDDTITSAGIKHHANTIRETWTKRKFLSLYEISQQELKDGKPIDEILSATASDLFNLYTDQKVEGGEVSPASKRLPGLFAERGEIQQDDKDFVGLDTGFIHLNRVINGLMPSLFVYAGPPGSGKTTLLKQIVDNVSKSEGVPCIFFSYEQSLKELDIKTLSRISKINNRDIHRGKLIVDPVVDTGRWDKIKDACEQYSEFGEAQYIIEGTSKLTTDSIRAISQGILSKHKADQGLIAIDYLQIIPTTQRFNSTREKVSYLTSELRRIARALNSPVLVISSEARGSYDKKGLGVFKESGEIEYSADILGVLTKGLNEIEDRSTKRSLDLHIVKNRNGERATINLLFFPQFSCFEEVDKRDYVEPEGDL